MSKEDMAQGYMDGGKDHRTELPENSNYSPAYIHGWKNGRDDRIGKPHDTAANLREKAKIILEQNDE